MHLPAFEVPSQHSWAPVLRWNLEEDFPLSFDAFDISNPFLSLNTPKFRP